VFTASPPLGRSSQSAILVPVIPAGHSPRPDSPRQRVLPGGPCRTYNAFIELARRGRSLFEMSEIISVHSVVVAAKNGLSRVIEKEVAILNLKNDTYYGLDRVGAYVWELVQEPKSVAEIRRAMLEKYEIDEARCERELLDLLGELQSEGLIEVRSRDVG
jgi:Coenzyme PQQ synthesis protein D (PqqD)